MLRRPALSALTPMFLVRRSALMLTVTALSTAALVAVAPAAQAVVAPPEPTTIAVDGGNSLIVGPSGALQGSGDSSQMQLGSPAASWPDGIVTSLRTLAPLPDGATAVAIESNTGRFVVAADNGKVYGVGANFNGQLSSLATTVTSWTELPGLPTGPSAPKAIDVSTSQGCTLVLLDDGSVFRTGANNGGECPLTGTDKKLLTEMPGLTGKKAVDIALSSANPDDDHTVVLLDDGTVWGTGDNYYGQLVGATGEQTALTQLSGIASVTPAAVVAHDGDTYVIGTNGQVYGAGANIARQLTGTQALSVTSWQQLSGLPGGVQAVQVVGFGNGSAVLGSDDKLYVTGNIEMFDPAGESLNVGTLTLAPQPATMGTVEAIDASGGDLIARDNHGYVWGVGNNFYGQLTGPDNPINGFTLLDGQSQASVTAPAISGAGVYGSAFTATNGAWHIPPTSYAYQWLRNGAPIPGANAASYVPQREDTGTSLAVSVTALTTGVPNVSATSTAASIAKQIFNVKRPVIKGTAKRGKTLSFKSRGTWTASPSKYYYRWYRNGKPISGATKSTYTLRKADNNKRITAKVRVKRTGYYSASAYSSNYRRY